MNIPISAYNNTNGSTPFRNVDLNGGIVNESVNPKYASGLILASNDGGGNNPPSSVDPLPYSGPASQATTWEAYVLPSLITAAAIIASVLLTRK